MNGRNTRRNSSVGFATTSATFSGYCSATVFGASSPSTMWSAVMMVNAIATAMVCEVATEIGAGRRVEQRIDQRRERGLADPAEAEARHRDAELRGRDELVGIFERAPHRARHAAAFGEQLIDARLAHRDDRELGGHEKPVGQNQRQHREQADADVEDGAVH